MRHYPTDKDDFEEVKKLGAEQWMVDQLELNPGYVHWGPYEDYMRVDDKGWASRCIIETWADFGFALDDLNEVVNFYFDINRDSEKCAICDGSGYNAATKIISDSWYGHGPNDRWCHNITDHEVSALWENGRLHHDFKEKPTAEQVNEWSLKGLGHDSINHWICTQARAEREREGVYGLCERCGGDGHVFIEPDAHLGLVLWVIHPRKGCSRGVHIKRIERNELEQVYKYLNEAAQRNAERFQKIPKVKS